MIISSGQLVSSACLNSLSFFLSNPPVIKAESAYLRISSQTPRSATRLVLHPCQPGIQKYAQRLWLPLRPTRSSMRAFAIL